MPPRRIIVLILYTNRVWGEKEKSLDENFFSFYTFKFFYLNLLKFFFYSLKLEYILSTNYDIDCNIHCHICLRNSSFLKKNIQR